MAWSAEGQEVNAVSSVAGGAQQNKMTKGNAPSFVLKKFDNRQDFVQYLLAHNTLYKETQHPEFRPVQWHENNQSRNDTNAQIFYIILGTFLFIAFIHAVFNKYYKDLFHAFVSPTLSRRQLKDQLYQTPFPAFLLNLFFIVSFGVYLFLFLEQKGYLSELMPTYVVSIIILFLGAIYLIKYLSLRFLGWLLGLKEEVDGYIFTIFLINKIMGVFLLPFILLLAFGSLQLSTTALNISLVLVILLFIYRYFRALPLINSRTEINKFHFFLYLCAFEIAPILIIGKFFTLWVAGA